VSEAPLWLTIPLALLLAVLGAASVVMARGGYGASLTRKNRMGVHSPAAMASEEAFTLANRVAAPITAGAALVAILSAILMIFLPLPAAAGVVVGVVGLAGSMALLLVAGVLGDRAARQVPIPARKPSSAGCSGCACGGGGCAGISRSDPAAASGQA